MTKIKTVELPVTVLRWLCVLAEDGLYAPLSTEHPSNMTSEEKTAREMLIDSASDLDRSGKPTSYHIAARDMKEWQETRSGLSWMQVCGIARTLSTCRADARLGPGGLQDLDVIEELVHRNWKPGMNR
jgi:hypothetical protein